MDTHETRRLEPMEWAKVGVQYSSPVFQYFLAHSHKLNV